MPLDCQPRLLVNLPAYSLNNFIPCCGRGYRPAKVFVGPATRVRHASILQHSLGGEYVCLVGVRQEGVEPSRPKTPVPGTGAATSYATGACE
jgi:hypothetical protein